MSCTSGKLTKKTTGDNYDKSGVKDTRRENTKNGLRNKHCKKMNGSKRSP